MALAILSKTIGTLAWEMVPSAHFPMGRGGIIFSGLKQILLIIKQESASLETDDSSPQAPAILILIAAASRDPQQETAIWSILSWKEGRGMVITPSPEIPDTPTCTPHPAVCNSTPAASGLW